MVSSSLLALAAATAARATARLRKAPISLTDGAADRVRDLLNKRNKVGAYLGLGRFLSWLLSGASGQLPSNVQASVAGQASRSRFNCSGLPPLHRPAKVRR